MPTPEIHAEIVINSTAAAIVTLGAIAHLRLVCLAITQPERFVDLYPWLTRDMEENNTKQ